MTHRWATTALAAGTTLAMTGISLLGARPAWASTTIGLDPAGLPVTATDFASRTRPATDLVGLGPCGIAQPAADRDVWIFKLADASTGALVSVSSTFVPTGEIQAPDGPLMPKSPTTSLSASTPAPAIGPSVASPSRTIVVRQGAADPDGAVVGDSAWITGPTGWALTAASADVTTNVGTLELRAACPAEPSIKNVASGLDGPAPARLLARTAPARRQVTLPETGTDVASIATLGAGLVLTGTLLILAHGRRRPRPMPERDDGDIRRPVVTRT